jgi:FG-GAP-like repeat
LKYSTVIPVFTLLVGAGAVLLLTSCSAGQANVGQANVSAPTSRPLFAPAPGPPIKIAGPSNVSVVDMNNDGKPDLVVVSERSRTVSVLLGDGVGQFRAEAARTISVSSDPGEMSLGDVNGDGNRDLALASHDSYDVTLLLGDGKGALSLAPNSPIVMKEGQHPHTHGLGIGDLNGDGKLDLATVNNADNDISVSFGDGRGNFAKAPGSPYAVGPSPYPLAIGDMNNDGHLDIAATTTATGPQRAQQLSSSFALTLLLNEGRGIFRTILVPVRTGQPWFVAIGDVNSDRNPDLVATHHDRSQLTVLIGNGRGGFAETSGSPFDFGRSVWQMVLADGNRDSKADVIAATGNGVSVMLGDGRGNFKPAPHSPFLTGRGVWRLAAADVNGDGRIDVVTSNQESDLVGVLLGQ